MLKRILSMVLSVIMILGMGTTAFATEPTGKKEISSAEIIKHLNSTDFGKEITFTALPKTKSTNQQSLSFDSVEEAEMYLKKLMTERNQLEVRSKSFEKNQSYSLSKSNTGWYTNNVYWWGGGNTSLLSMTNADIRFYHKNGVVSKISVEDSYMTGIYGATWTHRRGTGTPVGGTNAKFSVTGTWFIGISVGGFPVGASFDETLKSPVISIY